MSDLNDLVPPEPGATNAIGTPDYIFVKQPVASKWSWSLGPHFSIRLTPVEDDEANWFHRWAQRLVLGIYWRRDP